MFDVNNFFSMRVGLASKETILKWSHGEVTKPETINYRTQKPERDGLFCEKIFGPTKDWECHCGKYKRIRYKGIVCEKCGVEVTKKDVRRERMGHIELAAPVSHIWYFKGIPSRMGLILDISPKNLEKVLYFVSYIVIDPKETKLQKLQLLTDFEYMDAIEKYGQDSFEAGMGAEAIQKLLRQIDLEALNIQLREELKSNSGQKKARAARRLEACESFRKSGNRPEWMIMDVIPVIPPDLRPMVPLDGGRYATSDLNDLYRRVINRNNRLKRLLELRSPSIMIRNEKRMLQEAVDALIDNGRRGKAVTGPGGRELKSLSDMLKGKQGRFRQNLLGKRVDYSGRSVIVVGPELKMHQCGLPKEMALELFKPFVIKRLMGSGIAANIRSAKRMVERATNDVWDVLEECIKEHPVLLNRAPTLHRLGIQAFEPILSEGRAIKLHPLVCTAFNADFDGDQMAVHLPLSVEAQAEARMLMLSVNNILAPKDGKPIAVPTQDMVLGAYYMTILREDGKGEGFGAGKRFCSRDEAELAYYNHEVGLQAPIQVYIPKKEIADAVSAKDAAPSKATGMELVNTSVGNIIYNYELPIKMRYFQKEGKTWRLGKLIDKKELGKLVGKAHSLYGNLGTAEVLDIVKRMGYDYACKAGLSIATSDIMVPEDKKHILDATELDVERVAKLYRKGLLTNQERYEKSISLWEEAKDKVTDSLLKNTMDKFNSVNMMATSGARGNAQQMAQLAGMVGLKQDTSSRTIERPVKANFREGLTILEYFISSHGARKGLADTALRTANSGYMTRRLVDVAQDVIVHDNDCDVEKFNVEKERATIIRQSLGMTPEEIKQKYIGRTTAKTMLAEDGTILYEGDVVITADNFDKFVAAGATTLVLTALPSEDEPVKKGKNVKEKTEEVIVSVKREDVNDKLKKSILEHFLPEKGHKHNFAEAVVDFFGNIVIPADTDFTEKAVEKLLQAEGVREFSVRFNDVPGIDVEAIVKFDGGEERLIESLEERIHGRNLAATIKGKSGTVYEINTYITDEIAKDIAAANTKVTIRSVMSCKSKFGVCCKCYGKNFATGRNADAGEAVGIIAAQSIGEPGTQLTMRTFHTGGVAGAEDITQGLPRVEEIFEARKPKSHGIIAEESGKVSIESTDNDKMRKITISSKENGSKEYNVPSTTKLLVEDGQKVEKGQRLSVGSLDPHDVLRISGVRAAQDYLVSEVVGEYHSQGVDINSKHIEVIVRQMMRKIRVEDCGDTDLLPGADVDIAEYNAANKAAIKAGKEPAQGHIILLGITKASLATDSFLSAASFQETTRVLTGAAIQGRVDPLLGLKENVIIGKLIPAGTGLQHYRNITIRHNE
ncbi:MAG: DNA-directed RNA polymerase subunit beta' [Phascolarctobacterium sp.]|nr:DNA-directed RNA polymerase subunit beta' [Candidatus Phascolarctobacterium caballi]